MLFTLSVLGLKAGKANVLWDASIVIEQTEATPGNMASVAVLAYGFGNINSFQCNIEFNADVLEFLSMTDLNPHIITASSNVIDNSVFALSWFGFPAKNIPDGDILFTMNFMFCDDLMTCAENETASTLDVVDGTAVIGFFANGTYTTTFLNYTSGLIYSPVPLRLLSINISGEGIVNVDGEPYTDVLVAEENTLFNLLAVPGADYLFSNWSGDINSDDNPTTVALIEDMHVTANFYEEIPGDSFLQGIVIENGASECFDNTNTIYVGGNIFDEFFIIENGGEAWLIAGERIALLPGTKVETGGYMHAAIDQNDPYCDSIIRCKQEPEKISGTTIIQNDLLHKENLQFQLYPNPASNQVTIDFYDVNLHKNIHVDILSIAGNNVINRVLAGESSIDINLTGLPGGIYLVRIRVGTDVYHQKLIIQ